MENQDEDRLLQRVAQGEVAAFNVLVNRVQERIFRLAWRMTGDAALAEDATAEVLFKIWTKSGQWRGQAAASTWIYRLAVRTVLDNERSARRRRPGGTSDVESTIDGRPNAAQAAEQDEERQAVADRLDAALQGLSAIDRALVHLYYYENRSLTEIEPILGSGRDALKMRLSRARQQLRQLLKDQ